MNQGKYITSTNLSKKNGGKKYEIDYAYLHLNTMRDTSFQLVLGEAKGFRDLENSDVKKMCEIADEFEILREPGVPAAGIRQVGRLDVATPLIAHRPLQQDHRHQNGP